MAFRIVILGSGKGSNARAILEAQRDGRLGKGIVTALFSDVEGAGILDLGAAFEVESRYLKANPGRPVLSKAYQASYIEAIKAQCPDLIVLAGFMRIIKPLLIETFPGKIINLHPSLLPAFPGLDGIGQALRYGVKFTGCTVHQVTPEVDAGPILDQAVVPVEPGETLESLSAKVHAAEHRLLPEVIRRLSLGEELNRNG